MANSQILKFPEKKESGKKTKSDPKEKLSKELLQELQKDDAYREFASAEEVYKLIGESLAKIRKAKKISVPDLAKKNRKVGKNHPANGKRGIQAIHHEASPSTCQCLESQTQHPIRIAHP